MKAAMATFLELLILVYTCVLVPFATVEGSQRDGNAYPARVLADINETIYVHVVPHTHDDVGWQMTVDEYYYECKLMCKYCLQQAVRIELLHTRTSNNMGHSRRVGQILILGYGLKMGERWVRYLNH